MIIRYTFFSGSTLLIIFIVLFSYFLVRLLHYSGFQSFIKFNLCFTDIYFQAVACLYFLSNVLQKEGFDFQVKFVLCYLLLHMSYLIIFFAQICFLYRLYFQMQKCNQFWVNAYSYCFLFKDDLNSVMSLAVRAVTDIVWILHQYQMKNILRQDLSSGDLFPDSTSISS